MVNGSSVLQIINGELLFSLKKYLVVNDSTNLKIIDGEWLFNLKNNWW